MRFGWVAYIQALLTAIASLFMGALMPTIAAVFRGTGAFRGINAERATGLAIVAAGFLESVFSPWFWISFLFFFSLFYVTAHLEHRSSRILLFWIPTVVICSFGLGLWTLFVYVMTHHGPGQP
jgi:hypothetical protein